MSKSADFKKGLYGRPATIKTKKSLFENHIQPYVTQGVPAEMVHRACRGWVTDELSLGSIKGCLVLLAEYMKATYKWEIDKKRLSHQYFSGMAKPPQKLKVWNKDQVTMALTMAECCDKELHSLMEVALGTGLRRGEVFGLKWTDIDFIDSTISVTRSLDISSGEIGPTKTNQARSIQMSERVAKSLEMSYTVGDEGFVFKTYFDPNIRLARVAKRVGAPIITFHGLRHTFSTTLLERGVSPKWVSQQLGHAKLTTTLDLYWSSFKEIQNLDDMYN